MRRLIIDEGCLRLFSETSEFKNILNFVKDLCLSVDECCDVDVDTECFSSKLCLFLNELFINVSQYKTSSNPTRYGNASFRFWLEDVEKLVETFFSMYIFEIAIKEEICEYLMRSFGSRERLDYGTGHELSFVCMLFCCKVSNLLKEDNYSYIVKFVFVHYWKLVRGIQNKFLLEPAGSLGVWGLDDYNFLPFLFGAAELRNHQYLKPCSIRDMVLLDQYKDRYVYFRAIYNMTLESNVSLRERSPILYDITGAKSWNKVYIGLLKMYENNVLNKLPVMQHFQFGKFIPFYHNGCELPSHDIHNHNGDCCGNRIPSIHATKNLDTYKCPMD